MNNRHKMMVSFFRSVWHGGVFLYRCFMVVAVPIFRFYDKYFNITSKDFIFRFW